MDRVADRSATLRHHLSLPELTDGAVSDIVSPRCETRPRSPLAGMERQIPRYRHLMHPIGRARSAAATKVLLEAPYQIAPHPALDSQPFEDRKLLCRDLAPFVRPPLPTRPIEQLQIILQRDTQESLVAGSQALLVSHRTMGPQVQRHRSQPPIARNLGTLALGRRLAPLLQLLWRGRLQDRRCLFLVDRLHGCRRRFDLLALERFNSIVCRRVLRFIQRFGHRSPDGIEVDVHAASQQACFVDDPLGAEATLPEGASALILAVGHPGDRFREGFHEPGDIR